MASVALTTGKEGINRYRIKGGARADTLYDAVNCYVTVSGSLRPREGTIIESTLPVGTVGLMAYKGKLYVFASETKDMSGTPGYGLYVLSHPSDAAATLADIHFAEPFLGYPYVVAEWSDGAIYHYWLQEGETWEAGKTYLPGAIVRPTTDSGIVYQLVGDTSGYTPWAANVVRAVDDVVVPTTDNGFYYTVTEVTTSTAKSGTSEPDWPTTEGEEVYEDADVDSPLSSSTSSTSSTGSTTLPSSVTDRYGKGNAEVE